MVAAQCSLARVHGHAAVAAAALRNVAAAAADQGRSETAPVEEQQHLATRIQVFFDRYDERNRYAVGGRRPAGVDKLQGRRRCPAGTPGQQHMFITARLAVVQHLERRRRRAENNGHIEILGARNGEIPGGIAQTFLLLE